MHAITITPGVTPPNPSTPFYFYPLQNALELNPLSSFWRILGTDRVRVRMDDYALQQIHDLHGASKVLYYLGLYLLGMVSYAFTLIIRLISLAKDCFHVLSAASTFLLAALLNVQLPENEPLNIKFSALLMVTSTAEILSAILGCICPPLAYSCDEWLHTIPQVDRCSLLETIALEIARVPEYPSHRYAHEKRGRIQAFENAAAPFRNYVFHDHLQQAYHTILRAGRPFGISSSWFSSSKTISRDEIVFLFSLSLTRLLDLSRRNMEISDVVPPMDMVEWKFLMDFKFLEAQKKIELLQFWRQTFIYMEENKDLNERLLVFMEVHEGKIPVKALTDYKKFVMVFHQQIIDAVGEEIDRMDPFHLQLILSRAIL